MRSLVVDETALEKVQSVLRYARKHIYYPGISDFIPGDDNNLVADLSTYRCVFSFTKGDDGKLYRHLSVSVPTDAYPNPVAASIIAGLFEFSDSRAGVESRVRDGEWMVSINKREKCIVIAEELKEKNEA